LKNGINSILFDVVSNLAIILCFIPFLFLGLKKMRQVNTYWVIGIYWLFNGLVNLPTSGLIQSAGGQSMLQGINHFYTVTETPMVLLAFAFASAGRWRKQLIWMILAFVAAESVLLAVRGYNTATCGLITGAGLVLVLSYSVAGLWQYLKKMEHSRFEDSMVFVYAALLFGYGSFLIIYIFAHYRTGPAGVTYNETDSFLLYYISLLLSASVTCTGLGSYGLRRKRARRRPSLVSGYSSSSS
jgi:hypothetical protein